MVVDIVGRGAGCSTLWQPCLPVSATVEPTDLSGFTWKKAIKTVSVCVSCLNSEYAKLFAICFNKILPLTCIYCLNFFSFWPRKSCLVCNYLAFFVYNIVASWIAFVSDRLHRSTTWQRCIPTGEEVKRQIQRQHCLKTHWRYFLLHLLFDNNFLYIVLMPAKCHITHLLATLTDYMWHRTHWREWHVRPHVQPVLLSYSGSFSCCQFASGSPTGWQSSPTRHYPLIYVSHLINDCLPTCTLWSCDRLFLYILGLHWRCW